MEQSSKRARSADVTLVDVRTAVERAASGDLQTALDPDAATAELSPLVRAVNRLLESHRTVIHARERSEARYRALVEEGHAAVYVFDLQQKTLRLIMDARMEALLGITGDQWQQDLSLLRQQVHPDDRERVEAVIIRAVREGTPYDMEYRLCTQQGPVLWVHDHAVIERDADGAPIRLHGVAMNITTRRRVEEALHESERRFERMAWRLPHVIFRWGAQGLEYISPACLQVFGRTPGEILRYPDPRDLLIHPDDRARIGELATNLMGGPVQFETRLLRPNGDTVWTEQSLLPIFDSHGWLIAIEGVVCDISERKRMEAMVRESEELFRSLAKLSPVGIFRTDSFGKYTYINEHGAQIIGKTFAESLGDGWMEALQADDRADVIRAWRRAVHDRVPFRAEFRFRHRDGRVRWVLGQALPETNADGELVGHVGTLTDITDRTRAEQALLDAARGKSEAVRLAADAERRRLARELHDGALQDLGAVKLLLEVEHKQERGERLMPAIERLTAVLTELRNVVDNLQPGDLSRASLQEAIAARAKWMTATKGIDLTLALDPEVCIPAAGIRDLYRIAQEAMANAIQHGNPSRISVRLQDDAKATVLEVEDDGDGFDVNAPSHGMGLMSMRERAAALGGDLVIDSVVGRGTCVHATIPIIETTPRRRNGSAPQDPTRGTNGAL